MNFKPLFLKSIFITAILVNNSCQQVPGQTTAAAISNTAVLDTKTASLTEDFETPDQAKPSYALGEVTFKSGTWLLDDALSGSSKADPKNSSRSVRIRNEGRLTMEFEVSGVFYVRIRHAAYGNDNASSWQLWASENGGKTYTQAGGTVISKSHTLQQASFKVNYTGNTRFQIRKISGGKNRINIDDFAINSEEERDTGGTETRIPEVKDNREEPSGSSNLLLGNPSRAGSADPDNFLVDHQYYTMSYNKTKACPNWVSWHIERDNLGGAGRINNFREDTSLPAGWYEADNTSYKESGFDKGHNCPSGDRTSSTAANSATFLMSNMIPQAPYHNQRTWEHLESYCRDQVKKGNEVYVIMGSYGSGGTGKNGYTTSIDHNRINVPAHIWKVVIVIPDGSNDLQRIKADTRVIAVNTPNDNNITPNWMNYLCTVKDIEKATGYNLLSALPQQVQDVIEVKKFKGGN